MSGSGTALVVSVRWAGPAGSLAVRSGEYVLRAQDGRESRPLAVTVERVVELPDGRDMSRFRFAAPDQAESFLRPGLRVELLVGSEVVGWATVPELHPSERPPGAAPPQPPVRLDEAELFEAELVFRVDRRYRHWLSARYGSETVFLRMNMRFPDESAYSLLVAVDETVDVDDLPSRWRREGPLGWPED